ncbi:helix-turn-helix domain-containing protein [Nocardioides jiangxiensis]|uniref:Helix-turn-helix domain-containing protein n=1 Tax=Nocardioides jiangxiensis TaxID=3064524 RepID=A0ABT9B0Y9_9ACTN|nr:helix-turn-helix domain-containing protein [Nocardioides sp. WY-20]MDO7868521.1 helix-turn-helix domain-containing protein [Nocardioides sp. WY-20]
MTTSPVTTYLDHDYGITPGDFLRAELAARGISQADLAVRASLSAKHLNQVITDTVPLSTDTAMRLERVLGISADLLARLDAAHQAQLGRTKSTAKLADYKEWFAQFNVADLVKHGVVTAKTTVESQIGELLDFFAVAEPSGYDKLYVEPLLSFRRAQHIAIDANATSLWLRLAERKAEPLVVGDYSRARFADLLDELPSLTLKPISQAWPELQERCAEVGVAVVYTPAIAKTGASAAVRWLGPEKPVIALTGRGGYEDSIWFSFFHEAGHIVLHPRRKSVVEFGAPDDADGAETQANDFAKKTVLRGKARTLAKLSTASEITELAASIGIHPGIAAGIWAFDKGSAGWSKAARIRRKLDDSALK